MTISVVNKPDRLIAAHHRLNGRDLARRLRVRWICRPVERLRAVPTTFASLMRDERCATAVEFGLVSLPFFALLGAIVQFTFMIWAQQTLDFALQKTVRTLLTGQFQTTNNQASGAASLLSTLKTNMCGSGASSNVTVFDCSGVKIDVRLGTSFTTSTPIAPVDSSTKDWATGFGTHYTCAPAGSIVIVTAAVKFPVFFKLLNTALVDFSDGSMLLQSTQVFRTEPYGASSC